MNSKVSFSAASRDYQAGRYTQSLATLNQLIDTQKDAKTYALLAKNLLQLGFKSDAAKAYGLAADCARARRLRIPEDCRQSCTWRPATRTTPC